MKIAEIFVIIGCGVVVIAAIVAAVIRKRKGKTCCDCDHCSMSCHRKKHK